MSNLSYLEEFGENNIDDRSLPLRIHNRRATTNDQPQRQVDLSKWRRKELDLFDKWQWAFTSPVFKDEFQFLFHPRTIMPYTSELMKPADEGFFGQVFKVKVHPAHIPQLSLASRATEITVALKKIKDDIPEEYMKYVSKERKNVAMLDMHGYESAHLIKPIAYYERAHNINDKGKSRCLIFPWADGGTLLQYCELFSDRPPGTKDIRWIIAQFAGLFSALDELHETNCRHGDLKPDNILWFRNDGVLQIADLGLATFHKLITDMRRERNQQTMTPSGNLRYSPPETGREGLANDPRSRLYDIWSMGCVLLEMLVWLAYGKEGADRFGKLTEHFFWTQVPGQPEPQVNTSVNLCMDCLNEDLRGCDALRSILELVRTGLLIIDVGGRKTAGDAAR